MGETLIVEGFARLLAEGRLPAALGRSADGEILDDELLILDGRKCRVIGLGIGLSCR